MTTDDGQDVASKLSSAVPATIATLSPELPANSSTRGIVTITWPYSHVRASFAFILAEPDFRIRLNRGQVRVNFTGLAAAAVGNCGLESQDEVVLALDGATWRPANTSRRQSVSGADIDYQLTFSDEVALQVHISLPGLTSSHRPLTLLYCTGQICGDWRSQARNDKRCSSCKTRRRPDTRPSCYFSSRAYTVYIPRSSGFRSFTTAVQDASQACACQYSRRGRVQLAGIHKKSKSLLWFTVRRRLRHL